MLVSVSGEPVSASASRTAAASEAESSAGPGYIITGPTKIAQVVNPVTDEVVPNTTELQFDVRWERAGENPGMRSCTLVVERKDGTEDPPIEFLMLSERSR